MTLQPGSQIREYAVMEKLRPGGMGSVYKVRNTRTQRVEALKVLHEDVAGDAEYRQRFEREVQVLSSLSDSRIAKVMTSFVDAGRQYLIMEYVEGRDLDEIMSRGPVPLAQAVEYVSQVLSALECARLQNVVHRDVKASNIRVTADGVVKLLDFGLAQKEDAPRLTERNVILGTPVSSSPEQCQGDPVDHRSDLYSVGVLLYELVAGRPPFSRSASTTELMYQHVHEEPTPPIATSPALNAVIMKALKKKPAERFSTAREFREALRGVTVDDSVPTRRSVPVATEQPAVRTMPWWPRALIGLAVGLGIGVMLYVVVPISTWTSIGINTWRLSVVWDHPLEHESEVVAALPDGRVIVNDGATLLWIRPDAHVRTKVDVDGLTSLTSGDDGRVFAAVRLRSRNGDGTMYWKHLIYELKEHEFGVNLLERANVLTADPIYVLRLSPEDELYGRTATSVLKINLAHGGLSWVRPHGRSGEAISSKVTDEGYRILRAGKPFAELGSTNGSGWGWTRIGRYGTDEFRAGTLTADGGALLYGEDDLHVPFLMSAAAGGRKQWDVPLPYPKPVQMIYSYADDGFVAKVGMEPAYHLAHLDAKGSLRGEWDDSNYRDIHTVYPLPDRRIVLLTAKHAVLLAR